MNLDELSIRELQKESARALSSMQATNNNIYQFNKLAHHNSHNWYKAVIEWYIEKWGGMPSEVGPASHVELILDD